MRSGPPPKEDDAKSLTQQNLPRCSKDMSRGCFGMGLGWLWVAAGDPGVHGVLLKWFRDGSGVVLRWIGVGPRVILGFEPGLSSVEVV